MSNNADFVSTGKPKVGGAVFRAAKGTTLPTTAVAELDTGFINLGYVSDQGLKRNVTRTTNDIKAWGGDIVDSAETDKNDQFVFELIEALNVEVMKTVYGDTNVTGTSVESGVSVTANSKELESHAYVIDEILSGNILRRTVIPNGKVSDIAEITDNDNDPIKYGITIKAKPDSSGNTHYEYFIKQTTQTTAAAGQE